MAEQEQPVRFEFEVTWDDRDAFDRFEHRRVFGKPRPEPGSWRFVRGLGLVCLAMTLGLWALHRSLLSLLLGGAVFGAIFLVASVGSRWFGWFDTRPAQRRLPIVQSLVGRYQGQFDGDGVEMRKDGMRERVAWRRVVRVETNGDALYVYRGEGRAWVIPGRADLRDAVVALWTTGREAPATRAVPPGGPGAVGPYDVGASDLAALHRAWARSFVPSVGDFASTAIPGFVAFGMWPWTHSLAGLVVGPLCVLYVAYVFVGRRVIQRLAIRRIANAQATEGGSDSELSAVRLLVGPEGLVEETSVSSMFEPWPSVVRVEVMAKVTGFYDNRGGVYVLPASAFPTTEAYLDFVEQALEYRRAAQPKAA